MRIRFAIKVFLISCIFCLGATFVYGQGFEWARQTEGLASAEGFAAATDNKGNVFVTGYFLESTTFGNMKISGGPIFVAKYSPGGDLVWVKSADGLSSDKAHAIAVDASGDAYITGLFSTFGKPTTFGKTTLTGTKGENVYVAKISSAGIWQWAVQAGSPTGGLQHNDFGTGISVDAAENSYVCGSFKRTIDFGDASLVSAGGSDVFVAKYNSSGEFQWARRAGGRARDIANAISVDASGNSYVTGGFEGTADFEDNTLVSKGNDDIFIAKYNSAGGLEWIHQAGGTNTDHGVGIGLDASNNVYICGALSSAFATFGDTTLKAASEGSNIFLAKCNSTGEFIWARLSADKFWGNVQSLGVDPSGNFFITGYYEGSAVFAGAELSANTVADRNIFIVKYNAAGEVQLAQNIDGKERTEGHGVGVDKSGNAYITGVFRDTVKFSSATLTTDNVPSMFVTKLNAIPVTVQKKNN